jgi:hypothetical protein
MAMPSAMERVNKHAYAHLVEYMTRRNIADYIDMFNSVMIGVHNITDAEVTLLFDYEIARAMNFNRTPESLS